MLDSGDHYLKKELYQLVQSNSEIFEFIQKGSLDGVWYWDLENPEQEWMSPRFWETFGIKPSTKKHLSSEWQDIINSDDLKTALDNFYKHLADPNHPYDQIVRYKHSDGSTVMIRCRGIAIRDANGKPIRMLGAHTNLTELAKQYEHKIQETEMVFSDVFNAAGLGIARLGLIGEIIDLNEQLAQMLQFSREELLNKTLCDLTHPNDCGKENEFVHELFQHELKSYKEERRFLKKDGSVLWGNLSITMVYLEDGTPDYFVATIDDITELVSIREKLSQINRDLKQQVELATKQQIQSDLLYKEVLNHSSELVALLDKDYRYLLINDAYSKFHDIKREDIIGKTPLEVHGKNIFEHALKPLFEPVLHSRIISYNNWMEIRNKGKRFISAKLVPFNAESDSIYKDGIIITVRDFTEQKLQEEEFRTQQALLTQQSKMALAGEMIAAIAHQWKQPLHVLKMTSDLLELSRLDENEHQMYVDVIRQQVNFLTETINDFRGFLMQTKTETEFCPCKIIEKVKTMFKDSFELNNISIQLSKHEHFTVMGNPHEFMQVILNIFTNAKDEFIKQKRKDGKIECSFSQHGQKGTILIQDNAGGISPELLPDKLFEPYVTTKEHVGTGIGLHIAKIIIEQTHHGKLFARNTDNGAQFGIKLPIIKANVSEEIAEKTQFEKV